MPPLNPWKGAAALVAQAKGRPLGLAALSLAGPAKSLSWLLPAPRTVLEGIGIPAVKLEMQSIPKMGHSRNLQAQQCHQKALQ